MEVQPPFVQFSFAGFHALLFTFAFDFLFLVCAFSASPTFR